MALTFEWDPRRDAANRRKPASVPTRQKAVVAKQLSRMVDHPRHADGEIRLTLLGVSVLHRLLAVLFTERGDDCVRIISARLATRHERDDYEEARP